MDFKLELVLVPVSDVDPAKTFYIEKASFTLAVDHRVSDELRIVQPTPPGSACLTTASGSSGHGPRAWPNSGPGCGQDIYIVHGQDSAPHERREAVEYPHPVRSAPHAVVTVQQLLEPSASVITASGYSAATGTRGPAESRADAVAGRYALPADARR